MLRIDCPYCGMRDELEFSFGGQAHIERPALECDDRTWAAYLFDRINPRGLHRERWCHSYGCGQWFNAVRDTSTHKVVAIYRLGDTLPACAAERVA